MLKRKYYSAGLAVLIGVATVVGSIEYRMGTLARMGPGYYPMLLGATLILLGLLIAFAPGSPETEKVDDELCSLRVPQHRIRAWTAIVGGLVAFMILGRFGGLVPAAFTLIFISALGDSNNTIKSAFWLATVVVAVSVVVFHYGMGLQFPLFTWG